MKKQNLFAFMLLATLTVQPIAFAESDSVAAEEIELSHDDIERISKDLALEAQNKSYDKETRKALKQVSKMFDAKSVSQDPPQKLNFAQRIGRKLGKGAAWVTTKTSKPFLNASAFLTGFFEKREKNKDVVALYQFFLNHQAEFDDLYKEASTVEEFAGLLVAKSEEIADRKSDKILRDFVKYLDPSIKIAEDGECDLSKLDLSQVDAAKLKPDYINNHPEFLELKPLVGELTQEQLDVLIETGYFDKKLPFSNTKEALPEVHEGAMAVAGQIIIPKIVLGVISKSLASLYVAPVIIADLGTAVSSYICLSAETKAKFETDKDLASFCSYVVNKSSYELLKSRAKGYVAGKKLKVKMKTKIEERKARRAAKKAKSSAAEVM